MIETLKSYLNKEDYYFIITNNKIYIKNYQKLISIKDNEILISINNKNYHIKGENFILKRSEDKELEIYGIIESINIYD